MVKQTGILAIAFATGAGLMLIAMGKPACGSELTVRVIQQPATVPGIAREPSAARFYDSRRPTVLNRPDAASYRVDTAPPNGCEDQGGFREASGPHRGRCFGY